MKYEVKTVEEYLLQIPEAHKEAINKLREIFTKSLPDKYVEKLQYDMISYVVPREVFPQGYHCNPEDDLCFLSLASQKKHIAVYHMGMYLREDLRSWFLEEYPKYVKAKPDVGKSCIRFKNPEAIPYPLIAELCGKMSRSEFIEKYEGILSRRK